MIPSDHISTYKGCLILCYWINYTATCQPIQFLYHQYIDILNVARTVVNILDYQIGQLRRKFSQKVLTELYSYILGWALPKYPPKQAELFYPLSYINTCGCCLGDATKFVLAICSCYLFHYTKQIGLLFTPQNNWTNKHAC